MILFETLWLLQKCDTETWSEHDTGKNGIDSLAGQCWHKPSICKNAISAKLNDVKHNKMRCTYI
jgi:hypothetical protein